MALPYRDANFLRGINYISYSTNGDGYAKYDQIASNIAPSGANWVSIVPSCFQDTNTSTDDLLRCRQRITVAAMAIRPPTPMWTLAITKAHAAGLKVMLKPQIEVRNGYRGQIGFGTGAGSEANWTTWFNSYKAAVIGRYAPIAQSFQCGSVHCWHGTRGHEHRSHLRPRYQRAAWSRLDGGRHVPAHALQPQGRERARTDEDHVRRELGHVTIAPKSRA